MVLPCLCESSDTVADLKVIFYNGGAIEATESSRPIELQYFDRSISEQISRVGVFVCHCGINIGGVVDVPRVVEYAKTLPAVVCAEENLYACSSEGLSRIKEAIRKYDFNRVVVASCTPRTHEPLFRTACEEAGLNKYLFQMANIREHCSWVHMHEPGRLRLEWASAGEGKRLPGS